MALMGIENKSERITRITEELCAECTVTTTPMTKQEFCETLNREYGAGIVPRGNISVREHAQAYKAYTDHCDLLKKTKEKGDEFLEKILGETDPKKTKKLTKREFEDRVGELCARGPLPRVEFKGDALRVLYENYEDDYEKMSSKKGKKTDDDSGETTDDTDSGSGETTDVSGLSSRQLTKLAKEQKKKEEDAAEKAREKKMAAAEKAKIAAGGFRKCKHCGDFTYDSKQKKCSICDDDFDFDA
ncbi:hypothetical protein FWD07_02555 [Candidatus Saccharibacteria bacterium]|nr:hypothetical protein [Candidatus Saccharibacteria bacterium]